MILPKTDMFVTLRNNGPSQEEKDQHWSMMVHGDGLDMKLQVETWTKYLESTLHIFVHRLRWCCVILIFGLGPCIFEITFHRLFSRVRIERETDLGWISAPFPRLHEIPSRLPINTTLGRRFRVWVLFS